MADATEATRVRTATVLVAVAVVLAGCSALLGSDRPEPTPEATATPTPTPRPIGLSASGVSDPYQLRTAHLEVLDGQSYTHEYTMTVSWGGAERGRVDTAIRVSADRSRLLLQREVMGEVPTWLMPVGSVERYDAGTTAYVRDPATDETSVEQSPPGASTSDSYVLGIDAVYRWLGDVDTAVTGTETVDGRTLYVVDGTADLVESARSVVRNVSVRALVAPSGLVVEFRAELDLRRKDPVADGRSRVHVVHEISHSAVGETTVPRPDWAAGGEPGTPGGEQTGGGSVDDGTGFGQPPVVPEPVGPTALRGPVGGR